jgi:hypothetical protein
VDLQEHRDVTIPDRNALFENTDKKDKKGEVPCNNCNAWFQPQDMLTSHREEHSYWSKEGKNNAGKTCVYCTHDLMRKEHAEGWLQGEPPTLEQCWAEICTNKKKKSENRTAAHKAAIKQINTNQRADKKNGIFHFEEGSKKERRREDYANLFGPHLISCCQAGDLFSAFTGFADKMETLRVMTENLEKWRKTEPRTKPKARPTTT